MSPELIARATAYGLTPGPTDTDRRWWCRDGQVESLVGYDGRRWWWAPEAWHYSDVDPHAPRFADEADALAAALDWLDAGEPEIVP